MVVQGIWLVPTLGTVFSEQALKGVAKGVLGQRVLQQARAQSCLLRPGSRNLSQFAIEST